MRGGGHAAKSGLLFRIDFGADLGVPGGRFDKKWRKGPDFWLDFLEDVVEEGGWS